MKKLLVLSLLFVSVVGFTQAGIISVNVNPAAVAGADVTGTEVVGLNGVQADDWVNISSATATAVDIGGAVVDYVSAYNFTATPALYQDGTQNAAMMTRAIRIGGPGDSTFTVSGLGSEYTDPGYEAYCFSPAESEKQRRNKLTQNRKTPLSCGNTIGSNQKEEPQNISDHYDSASYRKAVRYAITAARKVIRKNGDDPDKELPYWTPYQLRHTAATKVRKEMGYECAGATLGHTNMSATAIYAERNQGLADEAAKRFG